MEIMEKYLGVKLISAEPCSQDQSAGAKNFGDLSKLHGGIDKEGYKVVYEDGYTSWSPKDVFEKAYVKYQPYRDMTRVDGENQDYQMRVIVEAEQLQSKIDKLEIFIKNNVNFQLSSDKEQIRLKQQLLAMQYYVTILSERISNF